MSAIAFSPDGTHFASAAWSGTGRPRWEATLDPGEVIVWAFDRATTAVRPVHTIRAAHPARTFNLAFSPDGRTLATGGGDARPEWPFAELPPAGEATTAEGVRLWDVATGRKTAAFPCDRAHHVNALAWSPDGKTLAHTGVDGTRVRLLDPASGKERALLEAPTGALAFSPDGSQLAAVGCTGDGTGLVELWDPATGRKLASESRHEREVNCVVFTPDGRALLTGDSAGVLNLWDVNPPK